MNIVLMKRTGQSNQYHKTQYPERREGLHFKIYILIFSYYFLIINQNPTMNNCEDIHQQK